MHSAKIIMFMCFVLIAGLAYVFWLDQGCELDGVMTLQGKECFENL